MSASKTMLHIHEDKNFKIETTGTLASMDLSAADPIKSPNARSRAAMVEASELIKSRRARFAIACDLTDGIVKTSRK